MNSFNNGDVVLEDKPLFYDLHEDSNSFNNESNQDPILTKMVRQAYYQHIKSILRNNIAQTSAEVSEETLNNHAKEIELYALRACMSSSLYRHVMLNEINYIKYLTFIKIAVFEKKNVNSNVEHNCAPNTVSPEQLVSDEHSSSDLCTDRLNMYFSKYMEQKTDHDNDTSNRNMLPVVKSEACSEDSIPDKYEPNINLVETENCPNTDPLYDKVYEEMSKMFETENMKSEVEPNSQIIENIQNMLNLNKREEPIEYFFSKINSEVLWKEKLISRRQWLAFKLRHCILKIKKYFYLQVPEIKNVQTEAKPPRDKITQMCKKRVTWHVRNCLSIYFRKNCFRSVDEFRILAKNIVSRLLQINPWIDYKHIYRAISKVFDKRTEKVADVTQIHKIVSQVAKYVGHDKSVL